MTDPKLSIVIITLNEAKRLPLLLDDLKLQTFTGFEIIHVDSNSDDETVAISRQYAADFNHYQTIEMTCQGVSLGRNTGARAAKGKRLLFLDADTRLAPNFLMNSLRELDTHNSDVGIVLMSSKGLPWHHALGYKAFNLGIRATTHFFPTAIGACLFSTPSVHEAIGGFDENITLCEDCNYALKAFKTHDAFLRVLSTRFLFDPRRLDQDGFLETGLVYLKANLRRFFVGEMRNQEIAYPFGHYR
ncbi:MAG: glycosyltransferase [Pseudomonadota bacterium]